jgi:hypothetical protein
MATWIGKKKKKKKKKKTVTAHTYTSHYSVHCRIISQDTRFTVTVQDVIFLLPDTLFSILTLFIHIC